MDKYAYTSPFMCMATHIRTTHCTTIVSQFSFWQPHHSLDTNTTITMSSIAESFAPQPHTHFSMRSSNSASSSAARSASSAPFMAFLSAPTSM